MSADEDPDITQLLLDWKKGNVTSRDELWRRIDDKLRTIAHAKLEQEFRASGLDTAELVHECFISMVDRNRIDWQGRQHFFRTIAMVMQHFLVDQARKRNTVIHGGHLIRTEMEDTEDEVFRVDLDTILMVDQALEQLADKDSLLVQVVQMRFFAGFSIKETAQVLDIPVIKANRTWSFAKAYLYEYLKEKRSKDSPESQSSRS